MPIIASKTGISPSILNAGFVFAGTGAEIAALGSTAGPQIARCTASGSGFTADRVYFRLVGGTWNVLNQAKHTHDQADDDSGGLLSDILYANTNNVYRQEKWGWFGNVMLNEYTGTGAGCFADLATGSTKLSTGTENTSYANSRTGGRRHDWAQFSRVDLRIRADSGTNVIARAGVNMDTLSGSNTSAACYGIEFCTSTGVNWQLVSSDGTTRSITGSTAPGTTAAAQYYKIEHIPGAPGTGAVKLTTGMSASPFWTKTTNPPPASGGSDAAKTVSMGIKTTDTTQKNLYVWGFCFTSVPAFIDV
jgi:hypothetical protein